MILTLQNQKGGVGKTTLTLHLAHWLTLRGRRVLVVDADPQGSARDWLEARQSPTPFAVVGLDRPTLHRDLGPLLPGYDVVVIDAPPRVTDMGSVQDTCKKLSQGIRTRSPVPFGALLGEYFSLDEAIAHLGDT